MTFCTSGSSANRRRDFVDPFGEYAFAVKKRAIGLPQPMQFGARSAAPAQADDIETIECSDLSFGKTKRNDTCRSAAKAADHDALADADELMHRRIAAEKDIVADA